MTTHGRGAVMSLVMGSVAEALVRTSKIPLLARRPRKR
jgi:nucleotide-binding universal stress UspA family protein